MTAFSIDQAASVIRDAGGQIVGRTRLQKVVYLLSACGLEDSFSFEYRHYGPYSEDLATAVRIAGFSGLIEETQQPAQWGGSYSTYRTHLPIDPSVSEPRRRIVQLATEADSIELELAATAAFLAAEKCADPWGETARRKPEKAEGHRLDRAKDLYRRLREIETPVRLPSIT